MVCGAMQSKGRMIYGKDHLPRWLRSWALATLMHLLCTHTERLSFYYDASICVHEEICLAGWRSALP